MNSDLPPGWALATVDDLAGSTPNALAIGPFGSNLKVQDYRTAGVPLVFVREIRRAWFGGAETKCIEPAKARELAAHTVRPGDLLVTKMGDPPGDTVVYPLDRPAAVITSDCIKLTPDARLTSSTFLALLLRSPSVRDLLLEQTKGVAQQKLSLKRFREIPLPVPPINEQRRIVAKLEALLSRSRRAKEALDAIPALLERFRQSVLAAAFRGDLTRAWREKNPNVEPASKLLERIRAERRRRWEEAELEKMRGRGRVPSGEGWKSHYPLPPEADRAELPTLPQNWAWATLGELAWDAGYGTSTKCGYEGTGAPVLRIPNIARGRLDLSDLKWAKDPLDLTTADCLRTGDLLIVRTNGSRDLIGRAAVVSEALDRDYFFASYLIRFRLMGEPSLQSWVESVWSSPYHRSQLEGSAATSAGQYNVSLEKLSVIPIPVPSAEEVPVLLHLASSALRAAEHLVEQATGLKSKVSELDAGLLAKAFRGELVSQDPNDEPASVLLERIKAEREQQSDHAESTGRRKGRRQRKVA